MSDAGVGIIIGLGVDSSGVEPGLAPGEAAIRQLTQQERLGAVAFSDVESNAVSAAEAAKLFASQATGGLEQTNQALGTMRRGMMDAEENARLMGEMIGVHMPRTITRNLGEMLPAIANVSVALMGLWAVSEIEPFIEGVERAASALGGFGEAEKKAFQDAVTASDDALTHFKTIKEGISLEAEVNRNIAALSVEKDVLGQSGDMWVHYAKAVGDFLSGNAAAVGAEIGMAREQKLTIEQLADLEAKRLEQLNTRTALERTAHADAARTAKEDQDAARRSAAEAAKDEEFIHQSLAKWAQEDAATDQRGWENLKQLDAERARTAAEMGKQIAVERQADAQKIKDQQAINVEEIQFLGTLTQVTNQEQKQHDLAAQAGVDQMASQANATKHLSAARKELTGVTQLLHNVETGFSAALHGDMAAQLKAADAMGKIGDDVAVLIGNTKLAADIRGAIDAAFAIEYMAKYIASPWDGNALAASIQYGLASAEMFKVAGSGGRGGSAGGSGGGGSSSQYGHDNGGGAGARGGSGGGGGATTPGSGGTTIHMHLEGPGWTTENTMQLMAQMSALARSGQATLNATNAFYNGPKLG